ncbi:NAD(P)-binding domain-containing protein [Pseudonocardia ailaonensis]|uniref:NAD(P)-binding domain-containing protein n=1 Tax=Pseudonocardia ailaonensis TaxID=367279 RepID=A0ABN2NBS2_9PSEU
MSNISIIGTGNMARTLGTLAVAGGDTVEIMGRDRSRAADLAEAIGASTGEWGAVPAGDIVVLALLAEGVVPAVTRYGEALAGKVLVDISNPFTAAADGLTHGEETSVAEQVAAAAPEGARVVKAFNTIFRHVLESGRPDVFLAGDDAQAKAGVEAFVTGIGLRPFDVGGLRMAYWLEGAGVLTMGLARNGVGHWDFALGVTALPAGPS